MGAIEGAWFLLDFDNSRQDRQDACACSRRSCGKQGCVANLAADMVDWSFEVGWDNDERAFGGIFSFIDVAGYAPGALEWDMKLWWPCCEAAIAHLMVWERF